MADGAPLPHRLVLIDEGSALLRVTLEAGFIFAQERKPAGSERLLNICRRAFDGDAFVRLMTIAAAHLAFEHWMVMRQGKRCANFQVTLETRLRRFSRIDDRACSAASFDVQTPRPVARLAAHVLRVFTFCFESRVSGRSKIPRDLLVTCRAFFRADELRARDAGRSKNCSVRRAAGKQNYGQRDRSTGAPQQAFAPTVHPSS